MELKKINLSSIESAEMEKDPNEYKKNQRGYYKYEGDSHHNHPQRYIDTGGIPVRHFPVQYRGGSQMQPCDPATEETFEVAKPNHYFVKRNPPLGSYAGMEGGEWQSGESSLHPHEDAPNFKDHQQREMQYFPQNYESRVELSYGDSREVGRASEEQVRGYEEYLGARRESYQMPLPKELSKIPNNESNIHHLTEFCSLNKGTYFISMERKDLVFLTKLKEPVVGWFDDYLINGYLLRGLMMKAETFSANVYLFFEEDTPLLRKLFRIEDGKFFWRPSKRRLRIHILSNVERVEVFDNKHENYQGFVCFMVTEHTKNFKKPQVTVKKWLELRTYCRIYEPTSISKIYTDVIYDNLDHPDFPIDQEEQSFPVLINGEYGAREHEEGDIISLKKREVVIQNKKLLSAVIRLNHGTFQLVGESFEDFDELSRRIEYCLEIAEELNRHVMITNLIRYKKDLDSFIIFLLPRKPVLKLVDINLIDDNDRT